MPEGPEIRRAADQIEAAIKGKPVIQVYFGQDHLKHWQPRFTNTLVTRVDTYGKAMLTRFDNGLVIYTHNQLYGRWYIQPHQQYPDTQRQLRLAIHTQEQSALLYSASEIEVLATHEINQHPFISKLGPDVLDTTVNSDILLNRLQSKRFYHRQLASFLTDQTFVAGLGNYLRCEILFVAGLNPQLKPIDLTRQQLEALAQYILELPRQSYQTAGITLHLKTAKELMKKGASFEAARFWVFRREGLACYRCDDVIQKKNMGGQGCYYCKTCQRVR